MLLSLAAAVILTLGAIRLAGRRSLFELLKRALSSWGAAVRSTAREGGRTGMFQVYECCLAGSVCWSNLRLSLRTSIEKSIFNTG